MKITVCAKNYPSSCHPHRGTFLYSLIQELAAHGAEMAVIAPQPLSPSRLKAVNSAIYGPEAASVLRPLFLSCSVRRLGSFQMARLTSRFFRESAGRGFAALGTRPDVVYGHFLFLGGDAAVALGQRNGIPSVIALGESDITRYEEWLGLDRTRATAAAATGIICVSRIIQNYCMNRLGIPASRMLLARNGVDCDVFRPYSRPQMRAALGLPQDRPIVSFVGHFTERKGPNRVLSALSISNHKPVGVFLGAGPMTPRGEQVAFAGSVPRADVAKYLSASDLFVLPTLAEGSCNAVLEALACGLPIVSSDIPSIRDDVGTQPPVFLADPVDIRGIAAKIDHVIELGRRSAYDLSSLARRTAMSRTLKERAKRILCWLDDIALREPSKAG